MKRKFCGCYFYGNWDNLNLIEKANGWHCGNCKKEIHFDVILMLLEEKILRKQGKWKGLSIERKELNRKCELVIH